MSQNQKQQKKQSNNAPKQTESKTYADPKKLNGPNQPST